MDLDSAIRMHISVAEILLMCIYCLKYFIRDSVHLSNNICQTGSQTGTDSAGQTPKPTPAYCTPSSAGGH